MKSILLLLITFFLFCGISYSQDDSKTVFITVGGIGKNMEDAKQSALRSAIEQAFGAFISSKTEVFNDKIVADEMASISSGNIKSYEVLNESQLPDGTWVVTLKVVVSVDKLADFVQAKGITVEVNGGLFAFNIKQQILNEEGEIKTIAEMIGLLHEPMQISFDYIIQSGNPYSLDEENKYWEIPLTVIATANKNFDFCANYFIKILSALSLSQSEVESYISLKKKYYPVTIDYKDVKYKYYLRKLQSIHTVFSLQRKWESMIRLFNVFSGIDTLMGFEDVDKFELVSINAIAKYESRYYDGGLIFNFYNESQQFAKFTKKDKLSLLQIEQMNGYTIKPTGILSKYAHGGYVVTQNNGHGLVVAVSNYPPLNWDDAKTFCESLNINGYQDWKLPNKSQIESVFSNFKNLGLLGFSTGVDRIWTSSDDDEYAWVFFKSQKKS